MAKSAFEIKNQSFQLLCVKPMESDWSGLQEFVADQLTRAPDLLGACVLALDLTALPEPSEAALEDIQLRMRYAGVQSTVFVAVPETALAAKLRANGLPMLLPPISRRASEQASAQISSDVASDTLDSDNEDARAQQVKNSRKKRTQGNDFKDVLGSVFSQKVDSKVEPSAPVAKAAPEPKPEAVAAPAQSTQAPASVQAPVMQSAQRYDGQVRSGQQVYARGKDLLVTGNVGAGAEVIADGSIHIYGRLMGKVIAGAQGDTNARIYCLAFGAELVSIAGVFRVIDSMSSEIRGRAVQIYLEGERIHIEALA
jgi:septum site-determining protein MinC